MIKASDYYLNIWKRNSLLLPVSLDLFIEKANEGKIVVKYLRNGATETINTMLEGVDRFEVKIKGKLIYLIIYDTEGKEFIRCI